MMLGSHRYEEYLDTPNTVINKTILIADDDDIFRHVASSFLESIGYTVLEAENGIEALKVLRDHSIDLVLCDIAMPLLGGLELVEEISHEYPSLPVVVVSATENLSDVAQALKLGIKDFITKPITEYKQFAQSISETFEATEDTDCSVQDFSTAWFGVDDGELPGEKELHWHLTYLQQNPNIARQLLLALLPEQDSVQGVWQSNYRILQSTESMPLIFDYTWLMHGQLAFYLVDSESEKGDHNGESVASTLMIRALFHDYMRNLKEDTVKMSDLYHVITKGFHGLECAQPVKAVLGVVDFVGQTVEILPAGLDIQWESTQDKLSNHVMHGTPRLGETQVEHVIKQYPVTAFNTLTLNALGLYNFRFALKKV
ncbi:response regulator [Vibrio sp.]|nr:response regulator [Vibrio sp.]